MLDVLGKLVLELWIQLEDINEARNVETLEITISKSFDVATRFHDDVRPVDVFGDVASNQITFAWNLKIIERRKRVRLINGQILRVRQIT